MRLGKHSLCGPYVSPGHALFMEGALIPSHFLVNGRLILREVPAGTKDIEYFHIELEAHEIIFAEGTQVESFLVKDEAPDNAKNIKDFIAATRSRK